MHGLQSLNRVLRFLSAAAIVASFASANAFAAPSESGSVAEARAIYLLNFARFVEWPETAFSDWSAPITIVMVGDTETARALERLVKGRNANGREIVVKSTSAPADAATAHIVFVGRVELTKAVISEVGSRPVVTVGEEESFLSEGGLIRLFCIGTKMHCAINTKVSAAAGLKLNDKLMRAANG
jgi:hypothetical protein